MTVLLRATAVTKSFGQGALATPVVKGVSFELNAGELVLLMGPSGSGKTTLISLLVGALRPTSGQVELCGEPISELAEGAVSRVRRKHIGFVLQTDNLFPALTALDNVAEVARFRGFERKEALELAREALTQVGLSHRLGHRPGQLSGGQRQRVAIARALAGGPRLLVGDEITAALDGATALDVMGLVRNHVTPQTAALIVTHDKRLERFADRVVEIEDGLVHANRLVDSSALPGAA